MRCALLLLLKLIYNNSFLTVNQLVMKYIFTMHPNFLE